MTEPITDENKTELALQLGREIIALCLTKIDDPFDQKGAEMIWIALTSTLEGFHKSLSEIERMKAKEEGIAH